ncbi:MAG: hypothetical protein ABSG94_05535 [Brevinematales bacterium]|jgi:CheY-like chemotaxis protein
MPDARFEAEQYASRCGISIIDFMETKTAFIISGNDGIIRISAFNETHTIEDAREVITAFKAIVKDKKHPVLIDSSRVKDMSPESMHYYGSEEAMVSVSIIAIIIKSGISRMMANFFIGLGDSNNPPRKLFNDENKAVQWLKTSVTAKAAEMNILVYEPALPVQKLIIYTLIKNGIKCLCLQDKINILSRLNTNKFNAFICDCGPGASEIIEIVKKISQDAGLNYIKIILATETSTKIFLEEMIKIGIKGILVKPFVGEVFEKNVMKLLYGKDGVPDRRLTIRVEPDEDDRIMAAIRSSFTHKTVLGKVKFISMDVMAVELSGIEDLKENEEILNNNIKITINENDMSTNGIIIRKKGNVAVIKFVEMQDYYKNMLSSYIYRRLEF